MPRAIRIFVFVTALIGIPPRSSRGQSATLSQPAPAPPGSTGETIDGIAARIEDDILTESELRELAAFQQLVDGRSKPRAELIRELADQWIVRGDANTAKSPRPAQADIDRAYSELAKHFNSPEEFRERRAAVGLTEAGIRRMLAEQLFLSRFIDFRFRPAAQISDEEIEKYYREEFAPQLKGRSEPVPPLEDVDDTIREVLIQRAISERARKWLDETRDHLKIDVVDQGGGL
jgi:hypothetical protein